MEATLRGDHGPARIDSFEIDGTESEARAAHLRADVSQNYFK